MSAQQKRIVKMVLDGWLDKHIPSDERIAYYAEDRSRAGRTIERFIVEIDTGPIPEVAEDDDGGTNE